MRHRKAFNHLGRKSAHRQAMLANMASSLIIHKRITTTTAKAKALRTYVEPLITRSKEDSTHSRRVVFGYLKNKYAVAELFREISPKVADRPGGYTRILKLGNRPGDNADMCIIELVDYNEVMLAAAEEKTKTTRRSRRGRRKSAAATTVTPASEGTATETTDVAEETQEIPATETKEEQEKESAPSKESKAGETPEEEKKVEEPAGEAKAEAKEETEPPVENKKNVKEEKKTEGPAEKGKEE